MSLFNLFTALGGVGLFLFGMSVLEHSIAALAGNNLKKILQATTKSPLLGTLTGFVSTMVLQSSTVVTMMTLAFVGAGAMTLSGGIGVIFGSNIGTALSTAVVALIGFKIDLEQITLPLIGFAGLSLIIFKNPKIKLLANAVMGFGILFLGLSYIKEGMETMVELVDLSQYQSFPSLFYILIGFIVTVFVQSSTAATAITLSALVAGVIDIEPALAMVIGLNIGTTLTAALAGIGGTPDKKRLAFVHVSFNLIAGVIAWILLPPISYLLLEVGQLDREPILALLAFHVIFNVGGVLVLFWFIPIFANLSKRIFRDNFITQTKFISQVDPTISEAAVIAMEKEVALLIVKSLKFCTKLINISDQELATKSKPSIKIVAEYRGDVAFDHFKDYKSLKDFGFEIVSYGSLIPENTDNSDISQLKESCLNAVREILYADKLIKDIENNLDTLNQDKSEFCKQSYDRFRQRLFELMREIYRLLNSPDRDQTIHLELLQELQMQIQKDDTTILAELTTALSTNQIDPIIGQNILTINRSVVLASNGILKSVESLWTEM